MNIQFSGSFKRLNHQESGASQYNRSLRDDRKLLAAQIEIAAANAADRIIQEVDDAFQLTYDPFNAPDAICVKKYDGKAFQYLYLRNEYDQQVRSGITLKPGESAKAFIDRSIEFAKALKIELAAIDLRAAQVRAETEKVSGWVLPQVNVGYSLAEKMGVEKATALGNLIRKLAPEIATLPAEVGLELQERYADNQGMRLRVVKKAADGKTNSFSPLSQYGNENKLEQKVWWTGQSFPYFRYAESDTQFLRRSIAHAKKMIQLEKDVTAFDTAKAKALAESRGNFELENEFVFTKGLQPTLDIIGALKGASESLYGISPDLRLEFNDWDGQEVIQIERRRDSASSFLPVLISETDYERSNVYRRLGEDLESFLTRTLVRANDCMEDLAQRNAIRSRILDENDPGFVIAASPANT